MKSPHTGTEAHGHTSSATPRPEGTRDVLDVLASSIAKLEVSRPAFRIPAPGVPAEPARELLTEKMLADRWVCSRLLVLDEATSALDYDTERRVCDNLRDNLNHCTVFFITHRLSTIRRADLIVMMHQGAIVETGSHDELMALQGRYYALYRQQESS